jgi:hypothetical protein
MLLADSGYGDVGEFRGGLEARQVPDVVEVRADTSAYPGAGAPDHCCLHRQGPPTAAARPEGVVLAGPPHLASRPGSRPAWSLSGGGAARACNVAGSLRCGCARPGSPHAGWLLAEWPPRKATPVKYWLSNLPQT